MHRRRGRSPRCGTFASVSRSLCHVRATFGVAQGGLLATLRYDVPASDAEEHLELLNRQFLPAIATLSGVAGVHLLVADAAGSGEPNAEERARGVANVVPRWVILLEGWGDERPFTALAHAQLDAQKMQAIGAVGAMDLDCYRHQITHTGSA